MKRILVLILALALSISAFTGCGKKTEELNLYTWAEYVPADVIADFEKDTGIRVNYTNFETNEEMLAKLSAADGGDYDLILASDYIIKIAADEGLLSELDTSKIPNWENIDPIYQGFFYDPEDKYTVPYAPGIPLIVYNPDKVSIEIDGYEDLWDPSLVDQVGLMDTERVVTGITLKTLGASFNTEDLDLIRQAGEKLLELAPNIRMLHQDQTQNALIQGEINVAFLFTSQVALALQANPNFKVVYPKEGLGFGVDALFVPKNAPNKDNAHTFLNYILDGEVGARIATQTYYLCPNKVSYEYLPEEFHNSLMITTEDIPEGEFIQNISSEAEAVHNEIYTAFKAALD
ncbi:MAG: spermidine/putrescine ABC transporter substrate-binding protein [Lachnospiraceae bacterium]|nr:spermidine/putrescine ABC transporter substrate-binding protein [Lachnospiraceae bacterium]